ncbi:hypothetical protein BASA81_001822 [Batrachochytrium salamandrivorans]|nr:hypothetical protein BASA81_001822 [Batrachochytrium salamandrivorans]
MSFSGECPLCQAEFTDWIELETHASRCEGMEMRKQPKLMNDSYTEDDELEEQKLREEETRCFQRRLRQQNKAPAASLVLGDEGDSELEDDEIETLQDNLLSCPMCNRPPSSRCSTTR